MRTEFVSALVELAERDERVVLLTGDLGFGALEPFRERFPDRFFNAGVAEQNMIGLATGLAESGFIPFAYSIATFASMRPYEFIRNGPVLHELPVRVVGIGGGVDYGHNGVTHYALEDVGIMRVQSDLMIVVPADPMQALAAVEQTADHPGPIYFRIGKEAQPVPQLGGRFQIGRAEIVGDRGDVVIVALGPTARESLAAAELIAQSGVPTAVAVVSSFNPSPGQELVELMTDSSLVVTVESHYITNGLGSFVAELIAENAVSTRLVRCGVTEMPRGVTGSMAYLNDLYGLSAARISERALQALSLAP